MARVPRPDQRHTRGAGAAAPLAVWCLFAVVLALAPQLFSSSFAVSLWTQMGIAVVACLSYNLLLGQGGMLSFGHAVYTGLGAYLAIHLLRGLNQGDSWLPVSLVPLCGGLAGLACALLLGFLATRKSGTTFAMITLGLGELVFAAALMFPAVFGGESGVTANRVTGPAVFGITYATGVQVYYLVAAYTLVAAAAMFAFTRTPLGRLLNAVRDNPQRVGFVGYDPQRIRHLAFSIAGFFAGIAGGLAALHFEIVTPEVVGAARSGGYLLFTFLGGAGFFFGPVIGAVLMVLATVWLSELTRAWLLYVGLLFVFMVMFAPGGIAALVASNLQVVAAGRFRELLRPYAALGASAALALAGAAAMVEMLYHLQWSSAVERQLDFLGLRLDAHASSSWLGAAMVMLAGLALFDRARRRFADRWQAIQQTMAQRTK